MILAVVIVYAVVVLFRAIQVNLYHDKLLDQVSHASKCDIKQDKPWGWRYIELDRQFLNHGVALTLLPWLRLDHYIISDEFLKMDCTKKEIEEFEKELYDWRDRYFA